MPKDLYSKETVFKQAKQICSDINQQIPLASNRYRPSEDDEDNFDDELEQAEIEYFLNKHLSTLFNDFLKQHLIKKNEFSIDNHKNFIAMAIDSVGTFYEEFHAIGSVLYKPRELSLDKVRDSLKNTIDSKIEALLTGNHLTISNKKLDEKYQFSERMEKDLELIKHREIIGNLLHKCTISYVQEQKNPFQKMGKLHNDLSKLEQLTSGHHFDQTKCNTGYCGEHADLAIWKFFQSGLIYHVKNIEVITLDLLNLKDEKYNNHCFIAINRQSKSDLNDPQTWGENAVFFDAWNQLVCYATEFNSIPDEYLDYPRNVEWTVDSSYTDKDSRLCNNLDSNQKYYEITGNLTIDKRRTFLMDEYQLTSIEHGDFHHTAHLLIDLAEISRPANCPIPVEFFITTCSEKLITPISGLEKIAIAIHKDFFKLIAEGKTSVSVLQHGIASVMYEIFHHGLYAHYYKLEMDLYLSVDRDLIAHSHCGDTLIQYLRLAHHFLKTHQDESHEVHDNAFDYLYVDMQKKVLEQRIKALKTLLAAKDLVSKPRHEVSLRGEVVKELAHLTFKTYFMDSFKSKKDIPDKLTYLCSCLPHLKSELTPHELRNNHFSRRVREFISLLKSIHIDFNDPSELAAANQLIQNAYDLKVPGFDEIYIALTKPSKNKYDEIEGEIPTLGPFLKVSKMIKKIFESTEYDELSFLSRTFLELWDKEFMQLYDRWPSHSADIYIFDYYESHHHYPTGEQRYYGSKIGRFISRDFSIKNLNEVAGKMLLRQDKYIAKFLYVIGHYSDDVLKTITTDELFVLLTKYDGKKFRWFDCNYETKLHVFKHIISRQKLITDDFNASISFKEKLTLFIEKNANLLTSPTVGNNERPTKNFNGIATQFLLHQFTKIAQFGTVEEKLIVKDFFLTRNEPCSLHYIQSRYDDMPQEVDYDSLFIRFFFEERYLNTKVKLFDSSEKIQFYRQSRIFHAECSLPATQYINLFDLTYETLSLDCLVEIIEHLIVLNITTQRPIGDLLKEHLLQVKPYLLLSPDTKKIVYLMQKTRKPTADVLVKLVKQIKWNLPEHHSSLSFEQLSNLAYVYRAFNFSAYFPSPDQRVHYQNLLIQGIKQAAADKQLALLTNVLFNEDFSEPIADYQFVKTLIELFIDAAKSYGHDDGSDLYFTNIKPVLETIAKHASQRDKTSIFAKLLDTIQAQEQLCKFVDAALHTIKFKTYTKFKQYQDNVDDRKISGLAAISLYFGHKKRDQHELIDFLSSQLSDSSLNQFCNFVIDHPSRTDIMELMGADKYETVQIEERIEFYSLSLYHQFWDVSLEERAVIFDHLLIPAQKTISEDKEKAAYKQAIEFVGKKVFPNAYKKNSDDHFAMELLNSYLEKSNKYQRGFLLSGMLVASNQQDDAVTLTAGKKISILCEHMGPAYVKLAQAIHSYPETSPSLRDDLAHIKGHAHPPKRWELWRLISLHVSQQDRAKIKHTGSLLGSASYNLALEVTLQDDTKAVLILLREHAAIDADKGFTQLEETIKHCNHKRMNSIREPMLSILSEARKQSVIEMDPVASQQQFFLAQQQYVTNRYNLGGFYDFTIKPAQFLCGSDGYRFITQLEGIEFNELPSMTSTQVRLKKEVAKAIMTIELTNIFSGSPFDSDRHGNQVRVFANHRHVQLGMYDFGEMALEKPSDNEIALFCKALENLPSALLYYRSFDKAFESVISKQINLEKVTENKQYLMRIRKAILALHDFQMELTQPELFSVIKDVSDSPLINNSVKDALKNVLSAFNSSYIQNGFYNILGGFMSALRVTFFGETITLEKQEKDEIRINPPDF